MKLEKVVFAILILLGVSLGLQSGFQFLLFVEVYSRLHAENNRIPFDFPMGEVTEDEEPTPASHIDGAIWKRGGK